MSLVKKNGSPASLLEGPSFSDFFDLEKVFEQPWSSLVRKAFNFSMPAVNVKEQDNEFDIDVIAPGRRKEDFKLSVSNGSLTISSEHEQKHEEDNNNYTRREYSYESFSRSFALPENIKADNIKAHYQDGVLRVVVPKVEAAHLPSREIKVS